MVQINIASGVKQQYHTTITWSCLYAHVTKVKKRARRSDISAIMLDHSGATDALSANTYVDSQEEEPRLGDCKTPLRPEGSRW